MSRIKIFVSSLATAVLIGVPLARAAEPTGAISLREAIALALGQNPELVAYANDAGVSDARLVQAALRPSPEVSFTAEDFGGSGEFQGTDSLQSTFQLTQVLELGGKRAARIRAAEAGKPIIELEYEVRRLRVATETARAFIDLLGAQERLALARETLALTETVVPVLQRRIEAGRSSTAEAMRARVAVTSAQIVVGKEEGQVDLARARLAAQWGSTTPQFREASGNLELTPELPTLSALRELVERHPNLARALADGDQRAAQVAVEESKAVPNVTLSGGFRRLNDPSENVWTFAVGIPLPLLNRNQGSISEARLLALRAKSEARAIEVNLNTELAITYESLEDARIELTLLRSSVLPELQKALDLTNDGYLNGRFSYLELTETRRALAEARSQYLQALVNYQKAAAALRAFTGDLIQ